MTILPTSLYTCKQVQALDQAAITDSVSGFALMIKAGQAAFDLLTKRWPNQSRVSVVCGSGNNGGDGFIIAGLALESGLAVRVYCLVGPDRISGDAKLAYEFAIERGATPMVVGDVSVAAPVFDGVIVDALLGIGLKGEVRSDYDAVIRQINSARLPVLSVDIPSGLCGDTGQILGRAVNADCTITFIGRKRGLFTGQAKQRVGRLFFDDLGISSKASATVKTRVFTLAMNTPVLPPRSPDSHKGSFGKLVVVAGAEGMGGAGIMASESGFLSGAGVVHLVTYSEHAPAALARSPETMVVSMDDQAQIDRLLTDSTALVFGPGLGESSSRQRLFQRCLGNDGYEKSLVVDADGLNFLAQNRAHNSRWILTPHPGEAARLLNCTTADVQGDRFSAAQKIQSKYGGVCVLKGAGTVIATPHQLFVCEHGNPSMSTAGMGDVLSGLIGGLLAQGIGRVEAAKIGVWVHAQAGDRARDHRGKHLRATDIYPYLKDLW